ncbi:hypothetical protein KIPB_003496, partial [Kipferlia bialata]
AKYIMQTNATLLHRVPTEYLLRLECILVSVDGRPETTNAYRGDKVFDRIQQNVTDAIERGYSRSIVARMTCSLSTDIYEEVSYLLDSDRCPIPFDHVYWQLDVEFDAPMNNRWEDFPGWVRDTYVPGLERLHRDWMAQMRKTGKVGGIVPFTSTTETLLFSPDKPCGLRCSAGQEALSITTDGRVLACPIASPDNWNNIGTILCPKAQAAQEAELLAKNPDALKANHPEPLAEGQEEKAPTYHSCVNKANLTNPCPDCDIVGMCGGRCLYANLTQWWGPEGFDHVCDTVRALVRLVKSSDKEIQELIEAGKVDPEEFRYPAKQYSLEIIP